MGRFGRPHGIKGFVTVHSFTEPRENILQYNHWHILLPNGQKEIVLSHVEVQSKAIIAQIEGYAERESVAALTNREIVVQKKQLAHLETGEYYWHQLIGLEVFNRQDEHFGHVVEIMPTGSNDVLVVKGEKRHLIPYLPEQFVLEVDLAQNRIIVDWDKDF